MAFFKFRKNAGDSSATSAPPDSVEVMRKRAKHRLIGAAVLVLAGVIGFPLLFDNQPRPIAVDIPIEIPDKNKVKPLVVPAAPTQPVAVASEPAKPVAVAPATPPAPAPVPEAVPVEKPSKPAVTAAEAPAVAKKPDPKPVETPPAVAKPTESAKAKALLEGKDVVAKEPAAVDGRFVVQVGAFADVTKAREVRLKVEKAGLKTYTQVVETKEGRRIRVRVGPFAGRAEADQAAEKIKKLDLSAAVLTL